MHLSSVPQQPLAQDGMENPCSLSTWRTLHFELWLKNTRVVKYIHKLKNIHSYIHSQTLKTEEEGDTVSNK